MERVSNDSLDPPMLPIDYPGERPVEALEDEITELYAHISAATARLLVLIAELDRRGRYGAWGLRSCAHWLNYKCGISMGAAREKVRVARALKELPEISAAFAAGEISYSKVRAMTRVATPENESYLLMIACHGTAWHVESLVREYRSVRRSEELERARSQQERRDFRYYYDEDGSVVIHGRLPAEEGSLVVQAIEAARQAIYQDAPHLVKSEKNVPAGTSEIPADWDVPKQDQEPVGARRADALVALAEGYLANGPKALNGGERYQVTVHVDNAVLDDVEAEGRAHIENGPWLAADTVRRLACDASLVQMVDDLNGQPLDVGRKTRTIPPAIRRALKARDAACRFPGCTQRQWVDGHHIQHWAEGGATKLDNLVLLCRFHHRLVHEGGFGLYRDALGDFRFRRPDGRDLSPAHSLKRNGNLKHLIRVHRRLGLRINADTCITRWEGERMDHAMAVEGLCERDGIL